jgi:hypothetical protein
MKWKQPPLKEYKEVVFRFRTVRVHSVRLFVVPAHHALPIRAILARHVHRNLRFVRRYRVNCVAPRFNRHVRLNRLSVSMPIHVVTVMPDPVLHPFGVFSHACFQDSTTTMILTMDRADVPNLVTALNINIRIRVNTITIDDLLLIC